MSSFHTALSDIVTFFIMMIFATAIISLPLMLLWDWLVPSIFGLRTITWLEAWGLMFLCGLLFKPTGTSST